MRELRVLAPKDITLSYCVPRAQPSDSSDQENIVSDRLELEAKLTTSVAVVDVVLDFEMKEAGSSAGQRGFGGAILSGTSNVLLETSDA